MKKRLDYLDITKSLCILFVILGHYFTNDTNNFKIWFYTFHVPCFFFVSGIIINHNQKDINFKKFIYKKFKSLILPYYTFCLINGLIYTLFLYFTNNSNMNTFSLGKEILLGYGVCGLWFLFCLFFSKVLFFIINNIIKSKYIKLFCIISITLLSFYLGEKKQFVLIRRILLGTAYLSIGYKLHDIIENKSANYLKLVVLFALNIILTRINGDVGMYTMTLNNPLIFFINSIIGSLLIINISKMLINCSFLIYIGQNTLIILGTHFIFTKIFLFLYKYITNQSQTTILDGALMLFFIMLIELIIIKSKIFSSLINKGPLIY